MAILYTTRRPHWLVRLLALVIGLIGLILLLGGAYLVYVGGSPYYALAGLGLLATAWLLGRGSALALWLYVLVYAATLVWAIWEAGLDGWALVPRVVAPTVVLLFIVTAVPALLPRHFGWRAALLTDVVIIVAAAIIGLTLPNAKVTDYAGDLPAARPADTLADPSLRQAGADWPAYGGSESARRYSPLTQITPDNAGQLKRVWAVHTGDLPQSEFAQGKYGAETTPLKVGNALYLCTPKNIILSLDPATGQERWRYDPKVSDDWIPYTAACRGVTYYDVPGVPADQACASRIIEGTLDARLIAVDANTGAPCPGFGDNGAVDTKAGMGEVEPGMLSITAAPTIVRGIIVTGHQVLDGQIRSAPSGAIQGYDAVTGALRWAWDMKQPDLTGVPPDGRTYARGTPNMWTAASGDERLGLVYLPLGNSAVDYWSSQRSDVENRFATSLVALDVGTGRPVWNFQTVHKDVWDYDLGSQATLVDFPADGGAVPALVLPSKQGDIYVLDRRTGKPLTPVEEQPAPAGGVEPEQRSPTQPHSLYHTLRKADLTEKDMWGMSPIDQMVCRIEFRTATYSGFYTPPTSATHSIEYPGYNGGSDWGGIAVDPGRGIIVANYNDMPNYVRLVPRDEADRLGWTPRSQARGAIGGAEGAGDPQAETPFAVNVNAGWRLPVTGLLCKEPPYGGIRAIDLKSGKTLWDRPFGTARTNGPFGIPSMLPVDIGTPNNGGAVVTAGGVVFIAAATDNLVRAIDLKTGKTLWSDTLPGGGQATPMTYEEGGKQYVVIMAGGHHFMETPISDELIAYALP
ncbi:membrane-bound PQQ-dependent dehydrogenase, glucose/quinate/shikimate family [Pleomorphomonas carboxyditropha]|uniref:Membrane-bound PQQ-dependent dehydrogenase, glucose/quinate/shikimate family n=1 Tax=Pleomorphomonas carboxyditropha TaxID=2023338 RepID=A0A2G9WN56_9HYPH|nr:membrane-bound PQQ-dependent dehydrogenase, glucose/quinate/shikimate family [Pleomorphomonas carboxyditropha]PIO96149.1 membrane-bound PQQ-dependent dehydrogenase, glucose/quinate/shikimate family [Pleomorphomonas carboxyditropha]